MTKRKEKTDHDKFEDSLRDNDPSVPSGGQATADEGTSVAEEEMQSSSDEPSYVKIGDVKFGDTLVVVGDEFDCIHDGEEKEVKQYDNGRLYVSCDEGRHFLDRATDLHDYVIGMGAKPAKAV